MARAKKFIVECNWKMYKTIKAARAYINTLKQADQLIQEMVEFVVCVPFTMIQAVAQEAAGITCISPGAQDVHWLPEGPYTGEISAPQLADAGARYCFVGHSERRRDFGETDELTNKKAKALLKAGISPIVCLGDDLDARKRGLALNMVEREFLTCLEGLTPAEIENTVILYEPVWAVGHSETATPEQAEEGHVYIRQLLERTYPQATAWAVRIIYGGSVKLHNVEAMLQIRDIDGVGVGAASLDVQTFLQIAAICAKHAAASQ